MGREGDRSGVPARDDAAGQGPGTGRSLRDDVTAAWMAGLAAVDPEACVRRALAARTDLDPFSPRTFVVAVGKAAAGMARGAASAGCEDGGRSGRRLRGFVLLPEGAPADVPAGMEVLRGSHPHPGAEGMASTLRILDAVSGLGRGDLLLFLVSGGASALLEAPVEGLGPQDLVEVHRVLVASGAPIASINLVRCCLSAVKGGRLAEAARPARVATFAISDVEGDDPAVIGSGPTVPRALDPVAALAVLGPRAAGLPEGVRRRLASMPAVPGLATTVDFTVVASVANAAAAAAAELESRGYRVELEKAYLRGRTRDAAAALLARWGDRPRGPVAFVQGGETVVELGAGSRGRGGRCTDLASRLALGLGPATSSGRDAPERGRPGGEVAVAVAGTDGRDGSSAAAGAVVDGGTASRAAAAGLPLGPAIEAFDTETALEAAGDLLVTGPTGTNVGDLLVAAFR